MNAIRAAAVACIAITLAAARVAEEAWDEDFDHTGPRSFTGHSLVRFAVESAQAKASFDEAVERHSLDVWDEAPGSHAIVRVPPEVVLAELPFEHTVLHHDIQPLLLLEQTPAGDGFHQKYHSAAEIEAFVQQLAAKYPKVVKVEPVATSIQGKPITAVHIAAAGDTKNSDVVFVQSGQHAREWIGPAATMVMLDTVAQAAAAGKGLPFQLSSVPLVNPDGYQFTIDKDRMWRKNRDMKTLETMNNAQAVELKDSVQSLIQADEDSNCVGVDLNRNWATHWASTMKNGQVKKDEPKPCSETFVGFGALQEPEVKGVSKHVLGLGNRVKGFLDVHSYSQRLLPPGCNGYTVNAADEQEQLRTAKAVVGAMSNGGIQYQTGPCAKEMYVCSGTAGDWAYNEAKILHSYSLELRPSNAVLADPTGNGFVVKPDEIQATGKELLAGVTELAKHAQAHKKP